MIPSIRWHKLIDTDFDGQLRRNMTERLYYYIVDKAQGPQFRGILRKN